MRAFASAYVAWLLLTAVAAGRDIFVDNLNGDIYSTGLSRQPGEGYSGPARTIAAALRMAGPGDRIVLADTGQPYRESISFVGNRHGGSAFEPMWLVGNGAVLDGSVPIPADAWEHYEGQVFRFRPRILGHQQLFISGRPAPYVPPAAGFNLPGRLKPLEWTLIEGQIYFCVEPSKLPADYDLSHAVQQTGITLYHVQRVAITDLVVQGFRVDGINAANSARQIQLLGVTCRGNGRAGVAVGGASQVAVEGCTIGDNRLAQLLTLPHSETHVYRSELLPLTAPAWVDQGGRFFLGPKPLQGGLNEIRGE